MKTNHGTKILMIVTLAALLAIGVSAFADPETGYGRGMGYGYQMGPGGGDAPCGYSGRGMGSGPRGGRGFRGPGYLPQLSDEETKKLDEQRKVFFDATDDLRRNIYSKRLELRSEMAKKAPDAQKAAEIQKEISTLKSELAQKRIEHQIEVKKINPDLGMGFDGRGAGRFGGPGGGPCWR